MTPLRCLLLGLIMSSALGVTSINAQERVSFSSSDVDLTKGEPTKLTGLLFRQPSEGQHSAVILMHGCEGIYQAAGVVSKHYAQWAHELLAGGHVVLLVDSFAPRGFFSICPENSQGRLTVRPGYERARDAYGALVYLRNLTNVRPDRIGLMGWSHGATAALLAISNSHPSRPRGLKHGFAAAIGFYPRCGSLLGRDRAWATNTPLVIVNADKDTLAPPTPCMELADKARAVGAPVRVVVYPDVFRGFDVVGLSQREVPSDRAEGGTIIVGSNPEARAEALKSVLTFFAEHLQK